MIVDEANLLKSQTMSKSQDKEAQIKTIAKTTIVTETEITTRIMKKITTKIAA